MIEEACATWPGNWQPGATDRDPRRITDEHRLVYIARGENLIIVQAGYHY
jgi:Txe/YoeB family toxin of Txe-Axe toxin-antitoxin module